MLDKVLIMVFFLLADILTQIRRWLSLGCRILSRDTLGLLPQSASRALAERPGTLMAKTRICRVTASGRGQNSQY